MGFNNGDYASAPTSIIFEMDINKDGTWVRFCLDSLDEALNLATVEWTNFCNGGLASTAVTGSAPTWSFSSHIYYNSSIADLLKKRFDAGYTTLQNVPVRITNLLLDEQITFKGIVSDLSLSYPSDDMQTVSGTLALFNSTVNAKYVDPGTYANVTINILNTLGQGVGGVDVTLTDSTGGTTFTGTTVDNGQVLIPFVPFATYQVTASNIPEGYTFSGDDITTSATSSPDSYTYDLIASSTVILPTAPTNLWGMPGDTTVTLNWSAPTNTPTNPITSYNIYNGTTLVDTTTSATTLTYQVTGLTAGTQYTFEVSAVTSDGEGAKASLTMEPDIPVVQDVTATAGTTAGTIDITWSAPTVNDTLVDGYSVYVYESSATRPTTPSTTLDTTGSTYTASGLTSGTAYTVDVFAQVNDTDVPNSEGTASATPN